MQAYRFLWAAVLLLSQTALGQSFAYRASLGPVPADSFYQVALPPAITRHLQPGYADLRLYDAKKGREVPYLLVPLLRSFAPSPLRADELADWMLLSLPVSAARIRGPPGAAMLRGAAL